MRLVELESGEKFTILAIDYGTVNSPNSPAYEFIRGMQKENRKAMLAVLREHARRGPMFNDRVSRSLGGGIFEFKTRRGDRLLWFYPSNAHGRTVITHGFHKGGDKTPTTEIDRAKKIEFDYYDCLGETDGAPERSWSSS